MGPWPRASVVVLPWFFVNGAHRMIAGAASMGFGGKKGAAIGRKAGERLERRRRRPQLAVVSAERLRDGVEGAPRLPGRDGDGVGWSAAWLHSAVPPGVAVRLHTSPR